MNNRDKTRLLFLEYMLIFLFIIVLIIGIALNQKDKVLDQQIKNLNNQVYSHDNSYSYSKVQVTPNTTECYINGVLVPDA